ncbi:helix-turn-helix domain-containing protein [Saccharopolyspora sp. NPDC002376]
MVVLTGWVELTADERAELRAPVNSPDVAATVGTRARIVLWCAENRRKKDVAVLAAVSRPTVDLWLSRYEADRIAGLL